jgi:glycosyltransferase involved in cell wall biosynthesis
MARSQAAQGDMVYIISQEYNNAQRRINEYIKPFTTSHRLQFIRIQVRYKTDFIFDRYLNHQLDKTSQVVDLMHLHGVWDPILLYASYYCKKNQTPYVVTPHGMLDPWSLDQKKFKKYAAIKLVYRKFLNRSKTLQALTLDEKQNLQALKIKAPIFVIANGINADDYLAQDDRVVSLFDQLIQNRPHFIFLGRLHYKKGLDILIQAYATYKNRGGGNALIIAGPDDGVQSNLEMMIHDFYLQNDIYFVGPMYGDNKYMALKRACAFILTSRQEGFSMAVLEALAGGTPVIISNQCHFPDVANVKAGFVVPLNIDHISDAMLKLSEPDRAERMGKNGASLVMGNYTWPVITKKIHQVYSG